ncbi:MAG: ABC transporter substrate-binding protein [Pseudomonadales bacterium]|nr:ABC transporter substrate-binding protein [Pseudomonadales bacterium]
MIRVVHRLGVPRVVALWLVLLLCLPPLLWANDTVTIDRQIQPPHLDPTLTPSASVAEVTHMNVFQGLTRLTREAEVQPALATAWSVSDDGLTLTFNLRRGVVFHDGRPFNAEVAAFSLARLVDPDSGNPQRPLYSAIERIEVSAPFELRLHLTRPDALLPYRLAFSAAVIVHPDSVETNAARPIGTGPYRVLPWDGGPVSLTAFEDYWGPTPAIRHARFTFTANRIELENSLSAGKVDVHADASPLPSHLQLALHHDFSVLQGNGEGEVILALNHAHPALRDLRVRRALAHAIDRQALLSIYEQFTPQLIGSHFSPQHPAYVDLVDRYPYDPDRARALLREAGAESLSLTLSLPPPIYAERGGLHIASDLEAVGIAVQVERLSWPDWLDRVFNRKLYDITLISHVEPMDIDIYARDDYYFNYHSPEFQALWRRIERTQDEPQRNSLLGDAQRLISDDAVNVFLYMKPQHSIHRTGLKGLWQNAPIPAVVLEEMYWASP